MAKVRILDREMLLEGYLQVEKLVVRRTRFDGSVTRPLDRFVIHRPNAACAVVRNTERDTLVFVRQFRIASHVKGDAYLLELAAGLADPGEAPEEAARREILEELGYRIEQLALLHRFYPSPGISTECVYIYYAEVSDRDRMREGGGVEDEEEDLELHEVSVSEVSDLLSSGRIIDAKTLIGLYAFLARL